MCFSQPKYSGTHSIFWVRVLSICASIFHNGREVRLFFSDCRIYHFLSYFGCDAFETKSCLWNELELKVQCDACMRHVCETSPKVGVVFSVRDGPTPPRFWCVLSIETWVFFQTILNHIVETLVYTAVVYFIGIIVISRSWFQINFKIRGWHVLVIP